jgi:ATP-dependent Clp protease protease subunit
MKYFKTALIVTALILGISVVAYAQDIGAILDSLESSPASSGRKINLVGIIDVNSARKAVAQLKQFDSESNQEIEIDIMSPGGSVYDGFAIIDQMAASKSPIKTVCEGYCMSMGAFILTAGTLGHRFAMPNSTIMVHTVASEYSGHIKDMDNDVAEAHRLQNIINKILEKATGLDETKIMQLCDHDNFMSPETAKSLHLIDGIVGQ